MLGMSQQVSVRTSVRCCTRQTRRYVVLVFKIVKDATLNRETHNQNMQIGKSMPPNMAVDRRSSG